MHSVPRDGLPRARIHVRVEIRLHFDDRNPVARRDRSRPIGVLLRHDAHFVGTVAFQIIGRNEIELAHALALFADRGKVFGVLVNGNAGVLRVEIIEMPPYVVDADHAEQHVGLTGNHVPIPPRKQVRGRISAHACIADAEVVFGMKGKERVADKPHVPVAQSVGRIPLVRVRRGIACKNNYVSVM